MVHQHRIQDLQKQLLRARYPSLEMILKELKYEASQLRPCHR